MKKIILLSVLFFTFLLSAQVPQGISYQAIALNGSGTPVVSSNVRVKLTILDNTATGTVLYTENHLKTTNPQGLFSLVIGQGTVISGTFATINWATNSKFLKVEMDATGGTNYTLVGTTQLLSVPYAMHAGSVASIPASAVSGIGTDALKGGALIVLDDYTARGFYNGVWSSQTLTSFVGTGDILKSNGNFVIIDDYNLRGFYNGVWSTQAVTSFIGTSDAIISNGNFVIIDDYNLRGYYNGVWSTQAVTSFIGSGDVIQSNGSFVIIDDYTLRGFYNGVWSSQTATSFIGSGDVVVSNGRFLIIDDYNIRSFCNGVWSTQPVTSFIGTGDVISSDKN